MRLVTAFVFFALMGLQAYAGGVSDGGGSSVISSGHPIDSEMVKTQIPLMGKSILVWAYAQKLSFERLAPDKKARSPMRKLFVSSKSFIGEIENTTFELRMKGPCKDAQNRPVDGSVFGSQPGSLCLSPFYMAIKLDDRNYLQSIIALIIHEISHVFGTTESEAIAIQKIALDDFTNWTGWGNFDGSLSSSINDSIPIRIASVREILDLARLEMDGFEHPSFYSLEHRVRESFGYIGCSATGFGAECNFLRLPYELERKSAAIYVRSQILAEQMRANGGDVISANRIKSLFRGRPQISADAAELFYGPPSCFEDCREDLKKTTIENPSTKMGYEKEMKKLISSVQKALDKLIWLGQFRFGIYLNTVDL